MVCKCRLSVKVPIYTNASLLLLPLYDAGGEEEIFDTLLIPRLSFFGRTSFPSASFLRILNSRRPALTHN